MPKIIKELPRGQSRSRSPREPAESIHYNSRPSKFHSHLERLDRRQDEEKRAMYRRESELQKSFDDREISTVKKTFEEMLEDALKKEGGGVAASLDPVQEEPHSRHKSIFLKKNSSKRRFLKRKGVKEKRKMGKPKGKVKTKARGRKNKEGKIMTDSMLEFEQIEQINLQKSLENIVPGKHNQNLTTKEDRMISHWIWTEKTLGSRRKAI